MQLASGGLAMLWDTKNDVVVLVFLLHAMSMSTFLSGDAVHHFFVTTFTLQYFAPCLHSYIIWTYILHSYHAIAHEQTRFQYFSAADCYRCNASFTGCLARWAAHATMIVEAQAAAV